MTPLFSQISSSSLQKGAVQWVPDHKNFTFVKSRCPEWSKLPGKELDFVKTTCKVTSSICLFALNPGFQFGQFKKTQGGKTQGFSKFIATEILKPF